MDNRKIIVALYILGGMTLWFLSRQGVEFFYALSYQVRKLPGIGFARDAVPVAVGVLTVLVLLWNQRVNTWMDEVVAELRKVTWPTKEMVYRSTTVVIICILIASVFLAMFDLFWGKAVAYLLA